MEPHAASVLLAGENIKVACLVIHHCIQGEHQPQMLQVNHVGHIEGRTSMTVVYQVKDNPLHSSNNM